MRGNEVKRFKVYLLLYYQSCEPWYHGHTLALPRFPSVREHLKSAWESEEKMLTVLTGTISNWPPNYSYLFPSVSVWLEVFYIKAPDPRLPPQSLVFLFPPLQECQTTWPVWLDSVPCGLVLPLTDREMQTARVRRQTNKTNNNRKTELLCE